MSFKVNVFADPVYVIAPELRDIDSEVGILPKIVGPAAPARYKLESISSNITTTDKA
jgi:hypothetical protein